MSEVDVRLRRLEQTKRTQVSASTRQPSINEMSDGDCACRISGVVKD